MAFIIMPAVIYLWGLFKLWLSAIFVTPFKTTNMLWILVPVWLGWFVAEFFQEKTGTSLGNAISNAVIVLWASIDCTRQTTILIANHTITGTINIIIRFFIIGVVFIYGAFIVYLGLKGNKLIKYLGRIREVTYVFVIFTPMFYNALPLNWDLVIAAVLFFPLFYFAIELIDRYTPNPKAIIVDINDAAQDAAKMNPSKKPSASSVDASAKPINRPIQGRAFVPTDNQQKRYVSYHEPEQYPQINQIRYRR